MRISFTIILFFLISVSFSFAQEFDKAKLDNYFKALEDNNRFMGSVAVSKNGNVLYTKSLGFEDAEENVRASEISRYRIGSISKTFTAALIFLAVEQKLISLDQTLDKFYPVIPNADKIRISDLLYHRSGIHNFTSADDYTEWLHTAKTRTEMIELIAKGGSDFIPDTKSDYSNSNYVLLSFILEDVFKKPYGQLITEKITEPIGLRHTYFGGITNPATNECYSYSYDTKWMRASETDLSIPMGAGGIVSTPLDLIKFGDALFSGRIISMQSLEQMKTIKDGYGMGLFKVPFNEKRGYGHTGGIDGFSSTFFYFPDDKISFALTSNGNNYNNNEIAIAVLSAAYNQPYKIPEFNTYTFTPEQLELLVGTYSSNEVPIKIMITRKENVLWAQGTGQPSFPLEATGTNAFKFDQAGLKLVFNPIDKTMILKQGGGEFTFKKD